jgi:hypothetical protein
LRRSRSREGGAVAFVDQRDQDVGVDESHRR